jgi:hypothetical protein
VSLIEEFADNYTKATDAIADKLAAGRWSSGAATVSAGGEHLKLPAGTRLQFQLCAGVTIQP